MERDQGRYLGSKVYTLEKGVVWPSFHPDMKM